MQGHYSVHAHRLSCRRQKLKCPTHEMIARNVTYVARVMIVPIVQSSGGRTSNQQNVCRGLPFLEPRGCLTALFPCDKSSAQGQGLEGRLGHWTSPHWYSSLC